MSGAACHDTCIEHCAGIGVLVYLIEAIMVGQAGSSLWLSKHDVHHLFTKC